MKRDLEIRLYDNDLSTPTFEEQLRDKIQGAKFSTKLHGGFNTFSFTLRADLPEAWEWLTKRMFYRIIIADAEKTLWEGRIQDLELLAGAANATAYGYYSSLNDGIYHTAYNAVASVVIKAILTAECPQISSAQSNIDATDITIDSAADAAYADKSPRELVEKLLKFSDSTSGEWYFAIWEDRIPYLEKRSVSSVDWLVRLEDLRRMNLKHRGANLWNDVYAIYDVGGVLTRTAVSANATSKTKYGVTRKYAIPNLGTVAAAAAQAQRDVWLAEHKDIWPSLENFVIGDVVYDTDMVPYSSAWVRAGEVIRIMDLIPASADLTTVTRDALRTFYILETTYDIDNKENRIVVDTPGEGIDAVLARKL